ncbi:MAG TPA: quinone oxidoreductase [Deltaproteobacteria bacterium]|nr:quinone oxidoreductase [Candidatus Lambdaproteobacteria bacterium]HIN47860.1 quinone oxidoreductase [Deltaproteobacteria bacterium]
MFHSILIYEYGGPEVMKWEEISLHHPGRNEVRIEQKKVGLNFIDVYQRSGIYPLSLPSGIGMEGVGVVETIGEDVVNVKVGDRVGYVMGPPGSYAESRLYPADRLIKIPDYISDSQAAAILLKGLTVSYLINKTFPVKKGQTVLFHAAAGGVGLFACQWLNKLGVEVIGTVSSDEKAGIAKAHGCHHTINYTREDFTAGVEEITDGKGVPVVFDGVGADTFDGSLKCLSPFGVLVSFGAASGPPAELALAVLAKKALYVTRPSLAPHTATTELTEEISSPLFEAIRGGLSISINKTYPLKDAANAHRALQSRKTTGSTILEI